MLLFKLGEVDLECKHDDGYGGPEHDSCGAPAVSLAGGSLGAHVVTPYGTGAAPGIGKENKRVKYCVLLSQEWNLSNPKS